MDLQQIKVVLDKINALYKNMGADPRNISAIEKDLMRSYILKLYEAFIEVPVAATPAVAPPPPPPPPVEEPKTSPRITLRKPEPMPVTPPPPPAPAPEPVRTAPPAPEPVAPRQERPVVEAPPPAPAPVPVAPPPAPVPAPAPPQPPAPAPAPPPVQYDGEMDEIFSFSTARELSEKLSALPISDIKKAMGLNERIVTVNELFGGDQSSFDTALTMLNQLRSYEEAKDYLIRNVAVRYQWSSKDRKAKAKEFAKLVKRRFS